MCVILKIVENLFLFFLRPFYSLHLLSADFGSVMPKTLDSWSHSMPCFEDRFFSLSVWFEILCKGWMQSHQNMKNVLFCVLIFLRIYILVCICFFSLKPSPPGFPVNLPVIKKSDATELIFCMYFSDSLRKLMLLLLKLFRLIFLVSR